MSKKVLYTLEFPVRCSPTILYEFLSTPSGLQEWFADKVDERDGVFAFN
ncbi:MAG: START-like domain-containing protein, partial [Lacibacter sp.]